MHARGPFADYRQRAGGETLVGDCLLWSWRAGGLIARADPRRHRQRPLWLAHRADARRRAGAAPRARRPSLPARAAPSPRGRGRSEEHTSELQSLMRISYAVFCLKKKTKHHIQSPVENSYRPKNITNHTSLKINSNT